MPNDQETLQRAKQLIVAKNYDEARRILTPIQHHPTAQTWLAKLDQLSPSSSGSAEDSLLQHAKHLITQKQYDQARAILEQFPKNPTARQWLAKLDQMATPEPVFASDNLFPESDLKRLDTFEPRKTDSNVPTINPWNPSMLRILPVGIVCYPLNWWRLGKPEWAIETLLVGVLLLGALISSMLIGALVLDKFASPLGIGLLVTTGIANLVFWTTIHIAQSGAYQTWQRTHDPIAVIHHPYNLLRNFMIWGGIGVLGAVIMTAVLIVSLRDKVFDHERFSLTYPAGWEDVTASGGYCDDISFECPLHIRTSQYGYNSVAVTYYSGYDGYTLEALDDFLWQDTQSDIPEGVQQTSVEPTTVDGMAGIKREYLEFRSDGDPLYVMTIHLLIGDTLYEIVAWGETRAIFEEKRETTMQIINSIDFK